MYCSLFLLHFLHFTNFLIVYYSFFQSSYCQFQSLLRYLWKKNHFCSHFVKTNLILLYNMYLFFFQLNVTFYLGATSWGGGGGSELLPGGWNATPEVYTLNYKNDKVRFLFTLGWCPGIEKPRFLKIIQPSKKIRFLGVLIKKHIRILYAMYFKSKLFLREKHLNYNWAKRC